MKSPTAAVEEQVAEFLAASYGVDAQVSSVVQGLNWTFRADVGNGASYFLRLYRSFGRSRAEIYSEVNALLGIQATRYLAVAKPVAASGGHYVSDMSLDGEDKRNVAVFIGACGHSVEMSVEDFGLAGKALADLHSQRDATLAVQDRRVLPEDIVEGTIERIARHSPSGDKAAIRLSTLVKPFLGPAAVVEGPVGFCHGDFRLANMLNDSGRVTLFDFDDCGLGPQWLDLATIAWWLEQDQSGGSADVLWRAFLGGYGVMRSHAFDRVICEMVAIQQLRSLRFLLDYCSLDERLWAKTFERAFEVIGRASSSALRIGL